MSQLKQIVEKIRERIETEYEVSTEKVIEYEAEDLPIATVLLVDPGDQTVRQRPLHKKTASLAAVLYYGHDDDHLLEGIDHAEKLQSAVYQGPVPDTDDRLDGLAALVSHDRNEIHPLPDHQGVGIVKIHFAVTYHED